MFSNHRPVLYSFISLSVRLLTNPLTITLIAIKLTELEQGIYYTFISIAAIQWVFELGVSTCLIQKLAVEKNKDKQDALIKFGFVFFTISALILFFSLQLYSSWAFQTVDSVISWKWAWGIYSVFICLNILCNFLLVIEEGKLNVNHVYKCKLISGLVYALSLVISLAFDADLFSLGFAQASLFFCNLILNRKTLTSNISLISNRNISLKNVFYDIWSFQYKLSLVWIFGYFYWNGFIIYFFKNNSPEFAGKYGITFTLLSAISTIMSSWLTTKRSIIGSAISDGKIYLANRIFIANSIYAILGYSIFVVVMLFVLKVDYFQAFSSRFLSGHFLYEVVILRFVAMCTELLLVYLRAYNDEPLFKETILNYSLVPITIYVLHAFDSSNLIIIISSIIQFCFLIIMLRNGLNFIKRKKNEISSSNVCV
ncbi:hypothetical protein NTH33_003664 [Vibrio mimicus]